MIAMDINVTLTREQLEEILREKIEAETDRSVVAFDWDVTPVDARCYQGGGDASRLREKISVVAKLNPLTKAQLRSQGQR